MKKIILSMALIASATSALASDLTVSGNGSPKISYIESPGAAPKISVGAEASTLGLGFNIKANLTNQIGIKGSYNKFDYSTSATQEGIDYDIDLGLNSMGLALEYKPMASSGMFLTAGVRQNKNNASLTASIDQSITIGDTTYTANDIATLEGKVTFKKYAPTLGIGYDKEILPGLNLTGSLGAMMQGSANVDFNVTGPLADDATLQNEVAKEAAQLEDALNKFNIYPVASLSVTYRF